MITNNTLNSSPADILCMGLGWFPENPGGLDRYVYELTHQLAALGDHIELVSTNLPENNQNSLIRLTNLASSKTTLLQRLLLIRRNFPFNRANQFDAINLHFALYSMPILNALPKNVPITFSFHGPWSIESQQEGAGLISVQMKHWVERWVYHHCDRFIVLSNAFGEILHQKYKISRDRIYVIPGGVDTKRFCITQTRQEARAYLNWPQDRFILFTPRRLVHRMGLDKFLLALKQVKKKYPDIWLAVAGRGPLRDELERYVKELELEDQVRFLGFLPDKSLPIAYQAADLTVMPSQSLEGFGLVLLESLACGTPTLCTPVGGMPEVIGSFSPQLITTGSDAANLTEGLLQAVAQPELLPNRQECFDYVDTQFNWVDISKKIRHVLLARD